MRIRRRAGATTLALIIVVGGAASAGWGSPRHTVPLDTGSPIVAAAATSRFVLDTGYADHGQLSIGGWTTVRQIEPHTDGAMLVLLDRNDRSGTAIDSAVGRITADGRLDPRFAPGSAQPGVLDLGRPSTAPLTVRADGRFLAGDFRQYLASGLPDPAWTVAAMGNTEVMVETSGGQLIALLSNLGGTCLMGSVSKNGQFDTTSTRVLSAPCDGSRRPMPLRLSNGSTVIVVQSATTRAAMIWLRPDGTLEPAVGPGTGVVDIADSYGRISAVAGTPDGHVLLLARDSPSSFLTKVGSDGQRDATFAGNGVAMISGWAANLVVDDDGITIAVAMTNELGPPLAYHPAVTRLSASGRLDIGFNPTGIRPGWEDYLESGAAPTLAIGGPAGGNGDGRLVVTMSALSADATADHVVLLGWQDVNAPLRSIVEAGSAGAAATRVGNPHGV